MYLQEENYDVFQQKRKMEVSNQSFKFFKPFMAETTRKEFNRKNIKE